MNEAKIQRAALLSFVYHFGNPNRPAVENEYAQVITENGWTREQAAPYPKRLTAYGS